MPPEGVGQLVFTMGYPMTFPQHDWPPPNHMNRKFVGPVETLAPAHELEAHEHITPSFVRADGHAAWKVWVATLRAIDKQLHTDADHLLQRWWRGSSVGNNAFTP